MHNSLNEFDFASLNIAQAETEATKQDKYLKLQKEVTQFTKIEQLAHLV